MTTDELAALLQSLDPFYYWPNFGNLGDLLIAEGTRQFFRRRGLPYKEWSEDTELPQTYNLVCAGGARFTQNWCTPKAIHQLTAPEVAHCVILPHSINGVDTMMQQLPESAHVICREQPSYDYCRESASNAHVYLADDMALHLDLKELCPMDIEHPSADLSEEEEHTLHLLRKGLAEEMKSRVRSASVSVPMGNQEKKRVAFLLRKDSEKALQQVSPFSYDISPVWHTSGRDMRLNANMLLVFADALHQADIVVTDRLHVAIMCYKAGIPVYMADNSYHKLSGVYYQSLKGCASVHLLEDGVLPPELQAAWEKLNSPMRLFSHSLSTLPKRAVNRLLHIAKQIRRRF